MAESPPPTAVRLAAELVAGAGPAAAMRPQLEAWLAASPRFRAFATANAAKLRKKLRGALDTAAQLDVRLEILVAYRLHADRRLSLAWEPQGSRQGGPDFTLMLPGARATSIEVTRLRRSPDLADPGVPWLGKLRQLPPGVPNLVVIGIEGASAAALDVGASVRAIRARADTKDDAFLAARGFAGSRAFYERFLRLGAVIVVAEGAPDGDQAAPWSNGSARIAVPDAVLRTCLAALRSNP